MLHSASASNPSMEKNFCGIVIWRFADMLTFFISIRTLPFKEILFLVSEFIVCIFLPYVKHSPRKILNSKKLDRTGRGITFSPARSVQLFINH